MPPLIQKDGGDVQEDADVPAPAGDLWVFGYGSLMWSPGFPYSEMAKARLFGWHRAFCMGSIHYRGTREDPGLVLGLAPGGSCLGRVFRVAKADRLSTIAYLRERELISYVYLERILPVRFETRDAVAPALCYVADTKHPQFAGGLDLEAQARRILRCRGISGSNADYLRQTVASMDALGIRSSRLHRLLDCVEALAASSKNS